MGITKTVLFTSRQNRLANLLKALSHPARIAIIQQLVHSEHCICGELVSESGLAQATISQHLKELKKTGIIKGCASGKSVSYCIDVKIWKQVKKELDAFFSIKLPC